MRREGLGIGRISLVLPFFYKFETLFKVLVSCKVVFRFFQHFAFMSSALNAAALELFILVVFVLLQTLSVLCLAFSEKSHLRKHEAC